MTPILLIPGLVCSAELFLSQAAALWPYGPVTIASTLEGSTMEEMAAAILASAPPRFALAGISMGGYLAFEILRQAPERVVKLALLDTTARPDTEQQTALRQSLLSQLDAGADFAALMAPSMANLLRPEHRTDARLLEALALMARTVGVDGFRRQTKAIMGRIDSRPDLSGIRVPTVVIVGEEDALTPVDRAQEMADAIPGAKLVIIPEAGHASPLEQPDAVSRALVEWMAQEG